MKSIVIITNIMSPYRVDLFNHLSCTNDYKITIIYSSQSEDNRFWNIGKIEHDYKILKSKTIKIKKDLDWKYIHIPINILSTLKNLNPDVVIGSEYNPTVLSAFLWCKVNNKKFISWSDGTLNSEKNINFIQKKIRNIICKGANSFIASSTKTKEAQLYYGAQNNIFISYLAVDINKYLVNRDYGELSNNIICVGSLIKRKGFDLLFNAIKNIDINYKISIVGDGEEKENLKELCRELGIHKKVVFEGFKQREEIVELFKKSDLFILPSREDCFGLVINEAMCAGLPIISSKYVDGAYDLVRVGEGGYIIDPYDENMFAKAIEDILVNREKIMNMGIFNKYYIENFSIENVSKEFINAIKYTINKD